MKPSEIFYIFTFFLKQLKKIFFVMQNQCGYVNKKTTQKIVD